MPAVLAQVCARREDDDHDEEDDEEAPGSARSEREGRRCRGARSEHRTRQGTGRGPRLRHDAGGALLAEKRDRERFARAMSNLELPVEALVREALLYLRGARTSKQLTRRKAEAHAHAWALLDLYDDALPGRAPNPKADPTRAWGAAKLAREVTQYAWPRLRRRALLDKLGRLVVEQNDDLARFVGLERRPRAMRPFQDATAEAPAPDEVVVLGDLVATFGSTLGRVLANLAAAFDRQNEVLVEMRAIDDREASAEASAIEEAGAPAPAPSAPEPPRLPSRRRASPAKGGRRSG
jgi:hypothetical protein